MLLEVLGDGVDHALLRGLRKDVGRLLLVHEDVHEVLQHGNLAAVTQNAQVDDELPCPPWAGRQSGSWA